MKNSYLLSAAIGVVLLLTCNSLSAQNFPQQKTLMNVTKTDSITRKLYDIELGTIEECTYKGKSLSQVYNIIKKKDNYLKDTIPSSNIKYTLNRDKEDNVDTGDVEVTYQFKNSKHQLYIRVDHKYGISKIEITENKGNTTSIVMSAGD